MWAVLGGSGFEKFDGFEVVGAQEVETPFGMPSSAVVRAKVQGCDILFLSRHGKEHEYSPSHINYRANIFALKQCGASKILSISAVGSLQKELKPGECVVPTQYIDRTKSFRESSFCVPGVVSHVSLANPVHEALLEQVKNLLAGDSSIHYDKTYICMEGPAFSTKAESRMYRLLGADIVGMTHFPEYALAREAGLYYLPLTFVTDYDCWDDSISHVTLEQIIQIMTQNNKKAFALLSKIIPATKELYPHGCPELSLGSALFTPLEKLDPKIGSWMQVLCRGAA